MKLQPKSNCPLNKFEPCKQLDCAWFTQIRGTNPNTGQEVDDYACAVAWLPMLLIDNSQQQKQTGAAVESFRNEMTKANEISHKVLISTVLNNNPNLPFIER
jgi:hypothetical protein|tara:strand:+ start:125 stop:430 length:306 start_codon:yes stop_codon:yes gene_type:complete